MHKTMLTRLWILFFFIGIGCTSQPKKADVDLPVRSKVEYTTPEIIHRTAPSEDMSLVEHAPVEVTPVLASEPIVNPDIVPPPVLPLPIFDPPLPFEPIDDEDDHHRVVEKVETILFEDNFNAPFSVGTGTEKWSYFAFPPFVGNDAIETVENGILTVRSKGTNMTTQKPAFTLTVPQETMPTDTPGGVDHVKWLVYTNHVNPDNSIPGYKAEDGKELVCETWLRGQTFGTSGHPFGAAASGNNDIRLAAFALNTIDLETFIVFDFFISNTKIYAIYERLPFARQALGNYAAFTHQIELKDRQPHNYHHLEIRYDRKKGLVRWLIDNKEVFKVDSIGKRLDNQYLTINHGGDEPATPLVLNQLNCGMGHFTLLDAFLPSQTALVRLSSATGFYFHPITDAPLTFFDEMSLAGSRLFGQGVQTDVKKFLVKYLSYQ